VIVPAIEHDPHFRRIACTLTTRGLTFSFSAQRVARLLKLSICNSRVVVIAAC
jgi:hypothetical protein